MPAFSALLTAFEFFRFPLDSTGQSDDNFQRVLRRACDSVHTFLFVSEYSNHFSPLLFVFELVLELTLSLSMFPRVDEVSRALFARSCQRGLLFSPFASHAGDRYHRSGSLS